VAETAGVLVGGRYRLIEPVGQGAMGRVWRGHDEVLDREVAVKEILLPHGLDAEQRDLLIARVRREARSAARLNHPGIITVHDVAEHNGAPLIVMEFINGRSLAAVIREEGRLSPGRVAAIGAAMLDALQQAHAAGIVHRDLKPDNVLITGRRTVITDFGIASMAGATALTSTGARPGTALYMAPEQIEGEHATPASDLWSLGATLYAAVEGQTPFTGPTLHAVYHAIVSKAPRPTERAGPLEPILAALLVKDPGQRATADQTDQALAALLAPPAAGPIQPEPTTPSPAGPARTIPLLEQTLIDRQRVHDGALDSLVADHVSTIVTAIEEPLDLSDFDLAKNQLRTRIYPAEIDNGLIAARPFAPGLIEAVVVDTPTTVRTVTLAEAEGWPVAQDRLFELGRANVRGDGPLQCEEQEVGDVRLSVLHGWTFYAATHVIWLNEYMDLGPYGALVVMPSRSMIIAYPIRNKTGAAYGETVRAATELQVQAQHGYEDGPGSLSPHLFWWRSSGLTLLETRFKGDSLVLPRDFLATLSHLTAEQGDEPGAGRAGLSGPQNRSRGSWRWRPRQR
jgi:serine/threonine protein kinase